MRISDWSSDVCSADLAASRAALGWCLGSYAFTRYKETARNFSRLVWPKAADEGEVTHTATAISLVRDLINTPANDMGPAQLTERSEEHTSELQSLMRISYAVY